MDQRYLGLDVARAIAVGGMLVAHFASLDGTGGAWRVLPRFVDGKAMPLFVLLGGAGLSLLVARADHPVRTVLGRALFLLVLGLVLVEHVPLIAIIIHFYALYLAGGLLVRRLSDRGLLVVAGVVTLVGALTWQHLAPDAPVYRGIGEGVAPDPVALLTDLTISGIYPFLPSFAFFAVGMWVGRQALGERCVQVRLLAAGLVLALAGYVGGGLIEATVTDRGTIVEEGGQLTLSPEAAAWVAEARGITPEALDDLVDATVERTGESRRRVLQDLVVAAERATGAAPLDRWFDPAGHGNMPAWVLGATGVALATIGLSSLALGRFPRLLRPLVHAGQLALTLYVAQGLVMRWWYPDRAASAAYGDELVLTLVLFVVGAGFATAWRARFAHGPLEAALRWAGGPVSAPRPPRPVRPGR